MNIINYTLFILEYIYIYFEDIRPEFSEFHQNSEKIIDKQPVKHISIHNR